MNPPTQTRPEPLPIGNDIYLLKGLTAPKSSSDNEPNIILIFGWMGAKLAYLSKYMKVYQEIYPHATQILVKSNPEFFWSFERTRMNNLVPVAEILEAGGYSKGKRNRLQASGNPPRILVHSFSNGGGTQMYTLGNLLRARSIINASTGNPQPSGNIISALVIDSCPGDASLSLFIQAFTVTISNVFLRICMTIFITFFYIVLAIKTHVFRVKPLFERLKEGLLSTGGDGTNAILPWVNKETPRMYVYSKKDALISAPQIKKHVEEAKRRGLSVKVEVYEDTNHVEHGRKYPERYFGAVKDLWNAAVAMGRER